MDDAGISGAADVTAAGVTDVTVRVETGSAADVMEGADGTTSSNKVSLCLRDSFTESMRSSGITSFLLLLLAIVVAMLSIAASVKEEKVVVKTGSNEIDAEVGLIFLGLILGLMFRLLLGMPLKEALLA